MSVRLLVLALVLMMSACVSTDRRDADPEKAAAIYADLGLQYLRQGDLELALNKLERGLELDDKNAAAHHYIAEVYKQMNKPELAAQHFRQALRHDASNPMLLNNYGAFLCGRGEFQDSEKYFLRAADVPSYRTPELAYENLALCALKVENISKAETYFRKALQLRPTLPQSLYHMALIKYQRGDYLPARGFIERLHTLGKTPESLRLGIRIEEALGDDAAADRYRELLSQQFSGSE